MKFVLGIIMFLLLNTTAFAKYVDDGFENDDNDYKMYSSSISNDSIHIKFDGKDIYDNVEVSVYANLCLKDIDMEKLNDRIEYEKKSIFFKVFNTVKENILLAVVTSIFLAQLVYIIFHKQCDSKMPDKEFISMFVHWFYLSVVFFTIYVGYVFFVTYMEYQPSDGKARMERLVAIKPELNLLFEDGKNTYEKLHFARKLMYNKTCLLDQMYSVNFLHYQHLSQKKAP